MLNTLTLENFRKQENLTLEFEKGLVAIRGNNEASKSTCLEAIGYALFGAAALRQAFDKVVTWGKPESSLKVTLTFTLEGVQYTVCRKKSGAELTAPGVLVTGQKEVSGYVERLIGTDAKTASNMMFASQNALRGALTEGPAKAVELISQLADFDLIDRIVGLVQAKLPTGATKAVEERLKSLREQVAAGDVPPLDTSALEAEQLRINTSLGGKHSAREAMNAAAKDIDVVGARQLIGDAATARAKLESLDTQLAQAHAAAAVEVVPPTASQADIDGWRAALVSAKAEMGARIAWDAVKALKEPEVVWEGDRKSFDAEVDRLNSALKANTLKRNEAYLAHAEALGAQVREKTCGLCGKDLTDVPEVVERNSAWAGKAADAKAVMAQMDALGAVLNEDLTALKALQAEARTFETALQRHAAHLELVDDRVPANWRWKGEPPKQAHAHPDYNSQIKEAETALQVFSRAQGAKEVAVALAARLEAQHGAASEALAGAEAMLPMARERLKQHELMAGRVSELSAEIAALEGLAGKTEMEIAHQRALHSQLLRSQAQLQAQASQAAEELQGMNKNNALLAKLRQARPQIADKLWGIVLNSVSHYFSQTRGCISTIGRNSGTFTVDNYEVNSYSGSTIDSLGLALRIALTKVFLPAMPMMILDEPASGMDAERESNMLGTLAASGFEQILLVTHSEQAESFAQQVVRL